MHQEQSPAHDTASEAGQQAASALTAGLDDYRTTHPMVIGDVLRQLMGRKDFLTVEGNQRPDRIITRMLAVDQAAGTFIYDASPDAFHNRLLLEAEENYFSGNQDGIRIQFTGNQAQGVEFEGAFAFCAPLPQSLYRVQRREFFRANAPLVEAYTCNMVLPDQRPVSVEIVDLSLDGLGLRSKDPAMDALKTGTVLDKVVLNLGKRGTIETGLTVTNLRNIRDAEHPAYRMGCRFLRFPKSKEQELQRLITYLEIARRGRD